MGIIREAIIVKNRKVDIYKPEICPYCEIALDPKVIEAFTYKLDYNETLFVLMACPSCGNVFACEYNCGSSIEDVVRYNCVLNYNRILGGGAIKKQFSSEIEAVSPSFVEIYNQAYNAEQKGLNKIDGMGYRKAFEFLVKDYAIYMGLENKDTIIKMNLSQCIDLIFTKKEQEIFDRADWLGNDSTHYDNRHPEFDVEDLKKIIDICVSRIEASIREKSYIVKIERK